MKKSNTLSLLVLMVVMGFLVFITTPASTDCGCDDTCSTSQCESCE